MFADGGFTDLFIAYPVWAAGVRGPRLRALAERVALRVGADSAEGVELLARALAGTEAEVVVEVDSGQHRTGVAPEGAGQVAAAARRFGLGVAGCSHSRAIATGLAGGMRRHWTRRAPCKRREAALRRVGEGAGLRSGGSTPTAALVDESVLNESPGCTSSTTPSRSSSGPPTGTPSL